MLSESSSASLDLLSRLLFLKKEVSVPGPESNIDQDELVLIECLCIKHLKNII